VADRQPGHDGFGVEALVFHAGDFLAVELFGDLALVLLGEQLALLRFEVGQKGVAAAKLFLAGGGLFGEALLDERRQALMCAGAEFDGLVVVLDFRFDFFGAVVAVGALAALVEAADEVLIARSPDRPNSAPLRMA
jgi:hypothetical protein